jgi:putative thioredoxin
VTELTPESLVVPSLVVAATDADFANFVELSRTVPVIVDLWATWCEPCKQLSPALERVVNDLDGAVILVTVDVDANPQVADAFKVQSIPTVVALIGGQIAPLFQGAIPEADIRQVFDQLLQVAGENGVTGRVSVSVADEETELPAKEDLPPLHQEAFDALERADYAGAIDAYDRALLENPNDQLAREGRAQSRLVARLQGKTLADIRQAAAANPADVSATLDIADLDLSGGHVDDAFARLLDVFVSADQDARNTLRERLLELFLVVGESDPRVLSARTRLASLLF